MGKKKSNGAFNVVRGVKMLLNPPLHTPAASDVSLVQMTTTQAQLVEVKTYLNSIIDALHDHPSFLSRASTYWGGIPLWLKIVSGIILFGAIIAMGVIAHVVALAVVGGISAVGFIAGSFLLDDHYKTNIRSIDHLKEGVFGLVSALELAINVLDNIREQLSVEIDRFKQENQKFTASLGQLHLEITALSEQVLQLSTTEEALNATQNKLRQLTQDHEEINIAFAHRMTELEGVKRSMGLEIDRLSKVGVVLNGAVDSLVKTVIVDEHNRAEFQAKLDHFLKDSKAGFDQIAERICQAEQELVVVKADLERSNSRYEQLLDRQAVQVDQLEKMTTAATHRQAKPVCSLSHGLKNSIMFREMNTVTKHGVVSECSQDDELIDYRFFSRLMDTPSCK